MIAKNNLDFDIKGVLSLKSNNKKTELIDQKIGPKFKEIRRKEHISQDYLCEKVKITSSSALSRWENGEQGLPVEAVDKLLKVMHLSYSELIVSESDRKEIFNEIELFYQSNDNDKLKEITQELLSQFNNESEEFQKEELLIEAAVAANYYLDLSGEDLTDNSFKKSLIEQFKSIRPNHNEYIKQWRKRDVIVFGNTQLLLDSKTIFDLSRSLASYVYEEKMVSHRVSSTLLNAVFILIKKKDVYHAQKLLNLTKHLNFATSDTLAVNRIKFHTCLINYINTRNEYQVNQFIKSIEQQLQPDFDLAFNQVRRIYQK